MKQFEAGKQYDVLGGGVIRVTKRTNHYITFEVVENAVIRATSGSWIRTLYPGRKKVIRGFISGTEAILIESDVKHFHKYCFAEDER